MLRVDFGSNLSSQRGFSFEALLGQLMVRQLRKIFRRKQSKKGSCDSCNGKEWECVAVVDDCYELCTPACPGSHAL